MFRVSKLSYINIYMGKVKHIEKRVKHLGKLISWVSHSDYANDIHIVHASEVARFFLSRSFGDMEAYTSFALTLKTVSFSLLCCNGAVWEWEQNDKSRNNLSPVILTIIFCHIMIFLHDTLTAFECERGYSKGFFDFPNVMNVETTTHHLILIKMFI